MPRSSGTYTPPAGNPVISGTVISSAVQNNTINDIGNELTNSIPRDGTAPPTANLPMGNFKITGLGAATLATDVPQYQQIQSGASLYLTAVAGTNTITGTLSSPTLAAYAAGNTFRFTATGTNTGATTVNINALGAKAIQKDGSALVAGDIVSGRTYELIYDGTNFNLISGAGISANAVQAQAYTTFTTGGTSTAYTLTPTPALTALATGQRFNITFNATAGATPTLAISGLTAKNLKYYDNTATKQAVTSAQIIANLNTDVIYDGTDYVVLNPAGVSAAPATNTTYTTGTATNEYLTPAVARARNIVSGTTVATTSGTSIDFTGLPSWAKRITINFTGVSTTGTSVPLIQLGDSGGIENTGYLAAGANIPNGASPVVSTYTTGFGIGSALAANLLNGLCVITLLDSASNTWSALYSLSLSNSANVFIGSGSKATSAVLDRVRITTAGGTDTFDAGSINILYE